MIHLSLTETTNIKTQKEEKKATTGEEGWTQKDPPKREKRAGGLNLVSLCKCEEEKAGLDAACL